MVFFLLAFAQQILVKIVEGHFEENQNTISKKKKGKNTTLRYYINEILVDGG
jgi:hypothetical protein